MLTANAANSAPPLEKPSSIFPTIFLSIFPTIFPPAPLGGALDSCWQRWKLCDKVTQSLIEILKGICTKLGISRMGSGKHQGTNFPQLQISFTYY